MSEPPADRDREVRRSDARASDRADREPEGVSPDAPHTTPRDADRAAEDERGDGRNGPEATASGTSGDGALPGSLRVFSGLVALVGAWLVASPFLYGGASGTATWNNIVVGGAILLLAGYNATRTSRGVRPNVGGDGLVTVLGLWVVVAPFAVGYGSVAFAWSTLASGVVVAVLSGYNAYEGRRLGAAATPRSRA